MGLPGKQVRTQPLLWCIRFHYIVLYILSPSLIRVYSVPVAQRDLLDHKD